MEKVREKEPSKFSTISPAISIRTTDTVQKLNALRCLLVIHAHVDQQKVNNHTLHSHQPSLFFFQTEGCRCHLTYE